MAAAVQTHQGRCKVGIERSDETCGREARACSTHCTRKVRYGQLREGRYAYLFRDLRVQAESEDEDEDEGDEEDGTPT